MQTLKYRNEESLVMTNMAPLIGVLAIGGLGLYYLQQQPTDSDGSTTTTNPDGSTTTTNPDGSTTTTDADNSELRPDKEWLPADYGSSYFKEFVQGGVDEENNPFVVRQLYGGTEWKSSKKVKLIDYDVGSFGKLSGGINLVVKNGFRVKITVATKNNNFFKNNVYVNGNKDNKSMKSWINDNTDGSSTDESATVWMQGGDELEVDVDREHSGVRGFRLRLGGTDLHDKGGNFGDPNDEVTVKLASVERKNPHYDAERFGAEFNAVGGRIGAFGKLFRTIGRAGRATLSGLRLGGRAKAGAVASQIPAEIAPILRSKGLSPATATSIPVGESKATLQGLEGVADATNDGKRIKVATDYEAVSPINGKVIPKDSGGYVSVQSGMVLVRRLDDTNPIAGVGFLSGFKIPRPGVDGLIATTQVAIGLFVINTAYGLSKVLPSAIGDSIKNTYTTALGMNCEEDCAGSPNFDECVNNCNSRSNELLATIGTFGLLGILGVALVLRSGKGSTSAAEGIYYLS